MEPAESTRSGPRGGVFAVDGLVPRLAPDVFIAPGAIVVGDVEIGAGSSVWFNAVLRGDVAPVRVGERSNVQDCAVLHVDRGSPCVIGDDVTIGHGAIVHGCTVENGVTIGMGATVLSRSRIGEGAVIAAGALVLEDAEVPAGSLMVGVPARDRGALSDELQVRMARGTRHYVDNARQFRDTLRAAAQAVAPNGDAHGS